MPHAHVAGLRGELLQMLRGEGSIVRRLRHATVALIPRLPEWPGDRPIHLQVDGGLAGQSYGGARSDAEPVHIRQWPDGRYAAAHCVDAAPAYWVDCGSHADSLFEAVLEGLQQRDGLQHQQVTRALRQGSDAANTDAQWLRQRLAQQLEQGGPATSRFLEEVATAAPQAGRAADHPPGFNRITPSRLQRILEDRSPLTTREALAKAHNVKPRQLAQLLNSRLEPTVTGADMVWRATQQKKRTIPLTPDVLRTIEQQVKDGRIRETRHLVETAREFNVAFDSLRRHVRPSKGLTARGKAFLEQSWSEHRASYMRGVARRTGHDPASLGPIPLRAQTTPPAPGKPVPITADLVLQILDGGRAGIAGGQGLHGVAKLHRVSPAALYQYLSVRTWTLTERGVQFVRNKYPDFRAGGRSEDPSGTLASGAAADARKDPPGAPSIARPRLDP